MENDVITTVTTSLISAASGGIGWFFGRRKQSAEVYALEMANIKGQFEVFQANYKRLEEINEELREENESLRKANTDLRTEIDKLEKDVKLMRTELSSLGSENQSLRIQLNRFESQTQ